MFYRTGVMTTQSFTLWEWELFTFFCSCDLDLDPMTFIYKADPYSLEVHWICENELHTSRLSKVIILQPANACI